MKTKTKSMPVSSILSALTFSIQRWNNSSFWYLENKDYDDGYLLNKFKQDEMYYSWV
jgi:hypothetical protein